MRSPRLRPSPAMIVAVLALVVAVGGTAFAATKIGTNGLKNGAVTNKKVKKKTLKGNRISKATIKGGKLKNLAVKNKKLADNAVNGSKVEDNSLSDAEIVDFEVLGGSFLQVAAGPAGANEGEARAAAPESSL